MNHLGYLLYLYLPTNNLYFILFFIRSNCIQISKVFESGFSLQVQLAKYWLASCESNLAIY